MSGFSVAVRGGLGAATLDVAFEAPGGITALFGRSGAGKSTVIAAVAGLYRPAWSRIAVGGTTLSDTDRSVFVLAEDRRVAVVFQEPRLFPHLSVDGNLRFAERRARAAPVLARAALLEVLGIGGLLARGVHTLSGGEAQRVAIGRAVLSAPRALLMDEPLSALDTQRRAEILPMVAAIGRAGVPILYVTHAADEAARIADTLVLLREGTVIASGSLCEMSSRADLPFAERDDAAAVLDGVAVRTAGALTIFRAGGREIAVAGSYPTGPARLSVAARDVIVATAPPAGISIHNILPGSIRRVVDGQARTLIEVALNGAALLARITPDATARLALTPGLPVFALVKATAIRVLDA